MDEHGENNMDDETIDTNDAITDDNSVGIPDKQAYHRPLKRNNRGQFVAGTGSRGYLGGRPVGAKDKITTTMIEMAQQTIEEHGVAMWNKLAKDDPTACLALISRLLPNKDLSEAIEGQTGGNDAIQQVSINVVGSPSPRLPDTRTDAQIQDRQRGLTAPVERLPEPSEAPPWDVPEDAVVATQEPTQEDMDALAAEQERERVARQNEALRAHGNLTGRAARRAAPDALDYPDDPSIV